LDFREKSLNGVKSEASTVVSNSKEQQLYESSPSSLRCPTLDTTSGSFLSTVGDGSVDNETFVSSRSFTANQKDNKHFSPLPKSPQVKSPMLDFNDANSPHTCPLKPKNSNIIDCSHSPNKIENEQARSLSPIPQHFVYHDQNKYEANWYSKTIFIFYKTMKFIYRSYDTRIRPKMYSSSIRPVFKKAPNMLTCFNNVYSPSRANITNAPFHHRPLIQVNRKASPIHLQRNQNMQRSTFSRPMFSPNPFQSRQIRPPFRNVTQPSLKSIPSIISTSLYKTCSPGPYRSIHMPTPYRPRFSHTAPTPPRFMPRQTYSPVHSKQPFTSLDKQTCPSFVPTVKTLKQPLFLSNCKTVPTSFSNIHRQATQPKTKRFSENILHQPTHTSFFPKNISHAGVNKTFY
jgi:hypothetical protein